MFKRDCFSLEEVRLRGTSLTSISMMTFDILVLHNPNPKEQETTTGERK